MTNYSNIRYNELCFMKGALCVSISPDEINLNLKAHSVKLEDIDGYKNRISRDGETYHVTIINPNEMKKLQKKDLLKDITESKKTIDLNVIGLGKVSHNGTTATYLVVISEAFQCIRKSVGLSKKDLHITLGFSHTDIHNVLKSFETIYFYDHTTLTELFKSMIATTDLTELSKSEEYCRFLSFMVKKRDDKLKELLLTLSCELIGNLKFKEYLHKALSLFLEEECYLVGVYFSSKYSLESFTLLECYDNFVNAVTKTELKFRKNDDMIIENSLKTLNFPLINNHKWLYQMDSHRHRVYCYYTFNSNELKFESMESPRNFSFVSETLAGSSIPDKTEYIRLFHLLEIDQVITLMENPLPSEIQTEMKKLNIKYNFYEVDDRTPMKFDQMLNILENVNQYKKTVIHCRGGVGRTATALASCLMASGKSREECMNVLAKRKTILSTSQEEFLKNWRSEMLSGKFDDKIKIHKTDNHDGQSNSVKETETKIKQKVQPKIKMPGVIMMVGLPASGKSTFSKIIYDQIVNVERISQDEIREKGVCEDLFSKYTKQKGKTVIPDRCNPTKAERKYWLDLNLSSNKEVWCVYMATPPEECKWRIKNRHDHPTVMARQGEKIVDAVAKIFEPPTMDEGFTKIEKISSIKEANQLLLRIGCDISALTEVNHDEIIKFPRTKHLKNLGSASRDDLLMTDLDIAKFIGVPVTVQEKIDGANMGLSIRDYKIIAQNRSHFVNSSYHPQFKLLDKWIQEHTTDLYNILEDETKILYGEWAYAKHSIEYTHLPDYFLAYDLYDLIEKRFYSRERLEKLLESTSIKLVPTIRSGIFKSIEDIASLVKTKSAFSDGQVEGVYVRRCSKDWLEDRGKIVRSNFICGNEHWTKNVMVVNKLLKKE